MHRNLLLELLAHHAPVDADERRSRDAIERFVRDHPDCFERSLTVGHVTGSAWLLDRTGTRVLLTRHRKLGRWLQLGGHADGDPDVLAVALREAREESGLEGIVPVRADIFDVDVHAIPAAPSEPAHHHYDVRFLLQAQVSDNVTVSEESHELAWFTSVELDRLPVDESVERLHRKWRELGLLRGC